MLSIGGILCESISLHGGWPGVFYLGGGICVSFGCSTPEEHPRVSKRELQLINNLLRANSEAVRVNRQM